MKVARKGTDIIPREEWEDARKSMLVIVYGAVVFAIGAVAGLIFLTLRIVS